MAEMRKNFAGRLLSQQSMDPELQEKYRKELENMFDLQVQGGKKAVSIAVVSLRILIGLFCLTLVFLNPVDSAAFRIINAVAAAMLLAMAGMGAYTIWRGRFTFRSHGNFSAYLTFYGALAISTIWILASSFNAGIPTQVAFIVIPIFVLILGVNKLIYNWIKQSEINTREQMLNLECKLAELAEKLEKSGN